MSTLKVDNLQTTAGVDKYLASAWVNFNGTGTVAIRTSGNISSITDAGGATYHPNFATAFTDANWSMSGACNQTDTTAFKAAAIAFQYNASQGTTSTAYTRVTGGENTRDVDVPYVNLMFIR